MRRVLCVLLLLALALAALCALGNRSLNEDLFLAFCSGRDTVNGLLAHPDDWSFTTGGVVWKDQSWLSHLVYYLSYRKFEDLGPVLVKSLLFSACLWILFFRCRALGVSCAGSLIAITMGTLSLAPFLGIRAENFGMLYFLLLTSLLTAPASWGRWRQLGAVLVLAVWGNSHGSFILGFVLIGTRLLIDIFSVMTKTKFQTPQVQTVPGVTVQSRATPPDNESERCQNHITERQPPTDVWGWLFALLIGILVMALANPYGPENLWIPVRQLTARPITAHWVDWLPLVDFPTLFEQGFLKPLSVLPFLALITVLGLLWAGIFLAEGLKQGAARLFGRPIKSNVLMEVSIAVILLPLAFRFRRMIIFAAPAMVPVLAVLIQGCVNLTKERLSKIERMWKWRYIAVISVAAGSVWLVLLSMLFYKSTVVPYLPGNPLASLPKERPLISQLMSYDLVWQDVARFLRDNRIHGRVFANEMLSDYLLFNVPDVKLFFDLRAQSVYSDEIINAYVSTITSGSKEPARFLNLLERFGITLVVLDTSLDLNAPNTYFPLAATLMATKKWACIYKDAWVFVLVRSDSERFGPAIRSGRLDELNYRSEQTKIVSQAFLLHFLSGTVPPELLDRLVTGVQEHPDPSVYSLIVSAMNGPSPCLNQKARRFLLSESKLVSASNYLVAGGGPFILRSSWQIMDMLERSEMVCGSPDLAAGYNNRKNEVRALFQRIKCQYDGL